MDPKDTVLDSWSMLWQMIPTIPLSLWHWCKFTTKRTRNWIGWSINPGYSNGISPLPPRMIGDSMRVVVQPANLLPGNSCVTWTSARQLNFYWKSYQHRGAVRQISLNRKQVTLAWNLFNVILARRKRPLLSCQTLLCIVFLAVREPQRHSYPEPRRIHTEMMKPMPPIDIPDSSDWMHWRLQRLLMQRDFWANELCKEWLTVFGRAKSFSGILWQSIQPRNLIFSTQG